MCKRRQRLIDALVWCGDVQRRLPASTWFRSLHGYLPVALHTLDSSLADMASQTGQTTKEVPYSALIPPKTGQTIDSLRNMVGAARYKEQQGLMQRKELEKELDELKAQ